MFPADVLEARGHALGNEVVVQPLHVVEVAQQRPRAAVLGGEVTQPHGELAVEEPVLVDARCRRGFNARTRFRHCGLLSGGPRCLQCDAVRALCEGRIQVRCCHRTSIMGP